MSKSRYPRSFAHPRYWPTWLAIGAMYIAAWLPWRLKMAIGKGLGLLAWRFAKRRRHITETNIALCFPEKSPQQQYQLVKDTFIANGIGLIETATGWCRDGESLRHRVAYIGEEHMARAEARGKGVIIVGVHFSSLDLGGALRALKEKQVARAVELSAEKYCSASIMLVNGGVEITHSFEIMEEART